MKIGLGLSPHQHDLEHYRFARQCGCTHLLLHLGDAANPMRGGVREGRSAAPYAGLKRQDPAVDPWTYEALARLTEQANATDLQIEVVDSLDPALSLETLLDGSRSARPIEKLKRTIRNVGKAGIPVLAYHLYLPPVGEREYGSFARGDAEAARIILPAAHRHGRRLVGERSLSLRVRNRLRRGLDELLAVAEEAGVTLAASADEVWLPMESDSLQAQSSVNIYDEFIGLNTSARHGLMFSVADMAGAGGDVYAALKTCMQSKRVACIRFGNVATTNGGAHETFVDDGDVDMVRIIRLLQADRYKGLIIAGHTPRMECAAPWHGGAAHTLGYLKAALQPPPEIV